MLFHGGGAGAEGAVHEAFELGEMEAEVVGWVTGAALFEDIDGLVEVHPLGDAEGEFSGVLELFEGQEVFPVGVVLDACDSVGECVCDGDGEGLATFFEGWWRNFAEDEGIGGGFAQDSRGFAGGVAVDFGAGGVGGGGGDVGGGEGGGVGYGHVTVHAAEDGGVAACYRVEVGAGGEGVVGPERVIPTSALYPCAGFGGGDVVADALLHLGE